MLVVAMISVDACPFFGFLRSDLSPWWYWNRCFLIALCHQIVRRPNLEVVTKRLLHQQAGKNTRVVLVPCLRVEVRSYSYFWWCGYFCSPWVSFVMTEEFLVRVMKITSRIGVSWTHSLPFYFKLNELWSYYQKHANQVIIVSINQVINQVSRITL